MIRIAAAAAVAATFALAPFAASAASNGEMTQKEKVAKRTEMMTKRFDRMDADKDGVVTRAEAEAQAGKAFDRLDTNKDGVIDDAELKAHSDRMKARLAKRGGDEAKAGKRADRFESSDADKDGKVTRVEFLAKAAPWFARADADKDGKVTREELAAVTAKMQKRAMRAMEKSAN